MRNTGDTTWGSGYQLVFLRGDQMGAPSSITVPATSPGQEVNLSVNITAPSTPGSFAGYWRLRNPQGTYFGPVMWVKISTQATGSHITVLSADPPSPSDSNRVRFHARVENNPNFRSMRIKVDGQVLYEEGSTEFYWEWNTAGYHPGDHSIVVEVADQTDTSWSRSESRGMIYTLTGTAGSNNHVPDRPRLISPSDWTVYYSGDTAHLCAQANGDPDGDPVNSYYFEVFGAEGWNSGWTGSSCVNTAGMGPYTYGWHVKVRDSRGGESDWSDSWHFTLVNSNLSITQLAFEPQDASSERVKIRACTAGQGGVNVTMKVGVNDANDGSDRGQWHILYELGVPCFNDIDAPIWDTLKYADGPHLVRVEAHGGNTGWEGATARQEVYTLPHRRPGGPSQYAPLPASGDHLEAVYLNSRQVTFKWESTLRSNSYTLHIGTNPNPQFDPNPVFRQTLGASTTEQTLTFNQDYSTLYWQVTANGDAGSSSSNDQKFGIDRTTPGCAIQPLAPITFENAFKVTWQGSDNLSGIARVDVQFLDSGRTDWVDWQTNQPSSKTFDMFTGQPGHSYSFRCRSLDAAGNPGIYPANPDTATKIDPTARPTETWWNAAYGFKRNIIILNNDNDWMPPHFPVRIHFDGSTSPTAAEIYNASSSAAKGNDIRIVYQNQTQLNRVVQRFSNTQIDIWIPLQAGLGSGAIDSTNYQIYYGNASAGDPPANVAAVFMPVADSNTVGLWHFQEGAGTFVAESSGNANHGTFSSGSWSDGFLGWTGAFNGTSSAVTIPHSSSLNTPAITVEAWINLTTYNNQAYPIVMKRLSNTPGGFEFHITNDRELRWITEGGWMNSSYGITLNQWHHVAATSNGVNQICIYVDGVSVKCQQAGPMAYNTAAVTIGFIHFSNGDIYFPGYIQHVRISNIARTDFPYAKINSQPSVAVGVQQTPPVTGIPDLTVISLNAYPNPGGGILVEAVVKNQGPVPTGNGFYTDLYLNHLPAGSRDYTGSLSFWVNDPIGAGATITLTTVIPELPTVANQPQSPACEISALLYAQADSVGLVTENDNVNNIYSEGIEVCTAAPDAYEGDDSAASASTISPGETQLHNFTSQSDQDWIKFNAQAGTTYTLHTLDLGESADTYLYVYDQDGKTLLASNDDYGGTLASQLEWKAPSAGTFYVLIRHWNPNISSCGTSYHFTIQQGHRQVYLPLISR